MTFRTVARRGYFYLIQQEEVFIYLRQLGAVLIYNGTINGNEIANLGSGGVTLNGTPSNVTIDANGMNFNGTTSVVSRAANAAINSLTEFTYMQVWKATTVGENSGGRLWNWDNVNTLGALGPGTAGAGNIDLRVGRATTAANSAFANFIGSFPSPEIITFMSWDGTDISGHAARAGDSALTAGTNTNGSGTVTSIAASTLYIGNRQLNDRTWNGYIKWFVIFNKVLTPTERLEVSQALGIVPLA